MNDRIQELAIEVFFDETTNAPSDKMYTLSEAKMQKFAELIVRRCIAQVALVGLTNFEDDPTSKVCMEAIESIQQHFDIQSQ